MRFSFLIMLVICLCSYGLGVWRGQAAPINAPRILYCQDSRCDEEIVAQISQAHRFVYFAVYTITRQSIVDAVIGAKLRGLDVRGITDVNQSITDEEKPQLNRMKTAGIPIEAPIKDNDGLMHIKLLVTDTVYVSGSYNWTTAATLYNDEVISSGDDTYSLSAYRNIFLELWKRYYASQR
jgi:phosphatidylserine/phosphatidylglycerophosphate/cardiolipin synthase-like enzyme